MSRAEQFDRLDFDLDDDEEDAADEAVVVPAQTMQQELSVLGGSQSRRGCGRSIRASSPGLAIQS